MSIDDLASIVVGHLCNCEGNEDLRVVLVVVLQIAVKFVVLGVVEQRDPLLVLVVLYDLVVQKVLLEGHTDRAEELVIFLVLHNDANDLLRLGIFERHHNGVRLFQVGAVNEFHVPVGVETHFILVLVVKDTRLKVDIVDVHIELVAKCELSAS